MKTENISTVVVNTGSKQAWTEPTLTTLAVSLETHMMASIGGDGGFAGSNVS